MMLVGITGGIGSGKSTVASMLQRLGATVVDADAISRNTTAANGLAMADIRRVFGETFVDSAGALAREKMRNLVFADASAKKKLESITHPLIGQIMRAQIASAKTKLVVLDIPLLAERSSFSAWRALLDVVCVVDCLEQTQITRVMARGKILEQQVRAIMANQTTRLARRALADMVIDNEDLNLVALEQLVRSVFVKL